LNHNPTYQIEKTALGTVELDHDGVIVIRVKEDCDINSNAMHQSMSVRVRVAGGVKRPVLIVLHPNFDLHASLPDIDRGALVSDSTLCEAIVASTNANENASRIYYQYSKPPFSHKVFRDEQEARKWLLEHV
jgi:hypothetical protein